jgi:hypothetical protein
MSLGVQGLSASFATSATSATPSSIAMPPLGSLNLTSGEEAQIEQILAALQGGVLDPTQAQARIAAVLSGDKTSILDRIHQRASGSATPDPLPKLNLTPGQHAQIDKIFQSAQAQGTSADEVRSQVNGVLTPDQRQQLAYLSSYTSTGAPSVPTPSYVLFANA